MNQDSVLGAFFRDSMDAAVSLSYKASKHGRVMALVEFVASCF